jgi:hypothetical protein
VIVLGYREDVMVFGVIYEYAERATGQSAYIGKAVGLYGHRKTLQAVHRRHMRGLAPVPFDFLLRKDECAFDLSVIDVLESGTGSTLQAILKPMEKQRVRERCPRYNCVRFA